METEALIEEIRKFPIIYDQINNKYRNAELKEKIWRQIAANLNYEGGADECKKKWSSVRDQLRRTLLKRKTKSGQAALKTRKYKYEDILSFLIPHLAEREGLSNVPKAQDDEEENEDNINEDIVIEETELHMNNDDAVEDNIYGSSGDNSSEPITHSSINYILAVNKAKPKATKRKATRPLDTEDSSASHQLMAYILAQKKAEIKASQPSELNPVDAFLGGISPALKLLNPLLFNEAKGQIFAVVQEMEAKQLKMNLSGQGHLMNYMTSQPVISTSPGDGIQNMDTFSKNYR